MITVPSRMFDSVKNDQSPYALYALAIHQFFILALIILATYLYFSHPELFLAKLFTYVVLSTTLLLILSFYISYALIKNKISLSKKKFIHIYSILSGIFISLFCYTFLPFSTLTQIYGHWISISILVSYVLIQVAALFCLSYYYKAFLYFVVPTFLPILYIANNFLIKEPASFLIELSVSIYLISLLIIGFFVSRFSQSFMINSLELKDLHRQSHAQQQHIQDLEQQLQTKQQIYQDINLEIEEHKNIVETRIKSYEKFIEKIGERFEHTQYNFERLHETVGIASWTWDISDNSIELGNFSHLFGYDIHNVTYQQYIQEFIHPHDAENFQKHMDLQFENLSDEYEIHYRFLHRIHGWIWIQDLGRVVQRDPINGSPLKMIGILRNIQHEKMTEERLNLSATAFNNMNQGVFILDDKFHYIDANPYFLSLVNFKKDELIGKYIFGISKFYTPNQELHPLHSRVIHQLTTTAQYNTEIIETLRNGKETPLWIHVHAVRDHQQKITHYVGIVTNLTERKETEEKLSYLQNYDAITDLPNRVYFNNKLHSVLTHSNQNDTRYAIFRINLDRFRYYNDLLNQNGGDELLKQVAKRLHHTVADAIVVARLNADDFAILLEIKAVQYEKVICAHCKNILRAFEVPFNIKQQEFIMTTSIGVVVSPEHGVQIDCLNHNIETALTEAKQLGGNTFKVARQAIRSSSEIRFTLEKELRQAVKNQEFSIYFQPKYHAKNGKVFGFEALVRWDHPERGMISPAEFIPLAVEIGLISEIGHQVIDLACKQIKVWSDAGFNNFTIAVNVDVQQIYRGHLIEALDSIITKYDIDPSQLELEITETSLMENNEHVKQLMSELKQRKIKIALDDFGIGYSSLSYLGDYAFDVIKIDRNFIEGIGNESKEAIVRAIIAMAKSMGKVVVAEGIEHQQQVDFLRKEGCDYLQGYFLSKPLPLHEATQLLYADK